MRPSVTHEPFHPMEFTNTKILANFRDNQSVVNPNQIRWLPFEIPRTNKPAVPGAEVSRESMANTTALQASSPHH